MKGTLKEYQNLNCHWWPITKDKTKDTSNRFSQKWFRNSYKFFLNGTSIYQIFKLFTNFLPVRQSAGSVCTLTVRLQKGSQPSLCVEEKGCLVQLYKLQEGPLRGTAASTCGTVHNVLHDKVRRLYYIERGPFAKNWGQMLFPSCFCLNFPDPAGLHAGPARNKAPAPSPRVTRTPFSLRALAPPSSRLQPAKRKRS